MSAGALSIKLVVPFPIPAHQTRRADFPHRAFRPASSSGPRSRFHDCFTRRQSCLGNLRIHMGAYQAFANVPLRSFFDSARRCCMIQLRREWGRFSNFSFRTPQRRISAYPARPSRLRM